jgi:GH18 family chitinase
VPYAYSNEMFSDSNSLVEWVGFDDVKSVELKVKYAIKNNLAGAMFWALDMVKI